MTKRVAAHLQLLTTGLANAWLLEDTAHGKRFLIDTGHAIERLPLLASLWKTGIRAPGDLAAVLLTHRHGDHAGNAAWVRKHFGAPVFCHENDAIILRGDKPAQTDRRKPSAFYKKWLRDAEDDRPAFCDVDDVFPEGAWKWGFQITAVPGHTDGSVMIYHGPTLTLFSGDSILVSGLLDWRRSRSLRFADPDLSSEPAVAQRSVRKFLQTLPPVEVLCPGHGPAVDEQAYLKLKRLLAPS